MVSSESDSFLGWHVSTSVSEVLPQMDQDEIFLRPKADLDFLVGAKAVTYLLVTFFIVRVGAIWILFFRASRLFATT